MPLVVDVPLNTSIADLDEALRKLLRRELERHGFEGVEIAFDAPSKDWSGKLTNPTVDLFLYDLREAVERASISPAEKRGNGQAIVTPPPLRLELTYSVTAWTKAVEDEHRLLSQVLAILFSHKKLPADLLGDSALNGGSVLAEADTSVGRPREEKADFWSSVGGTYKASIDYVVHITVESGASFVRGPEVRTQTLRTRIADGPARTMTEMTRIGGTLRDAAGEPVPNAWVAVPEAGLWAVSDDEGRYRFDRIRPGSHRVIARTASGDETEATIEVPGAPLDLEIGSGGRAGAKKSAERKK
jgi:Pvc16 N-terminal domain/Carboxypeptidase regulatory-like domain